ncbi:uncharacterized protein HMPREF1541_03017 [Cyphellophora europaea CBS 101466]|uniref:Uncharacterized protein n=1 Tax=Cyphellophora europaea (strain CBS 101466) TaxID=1220924 RepID=W2RXA8_CYPE1|nr:uncharacterized protein HMPREF1541_03017 [Cyphellophora europaea CBS 101466]ETN41082.1 hypothetical protein HMPREF1541_03017 [Cyphellophora europaea CBS 101466]
MPSLTETRQYTCRYWALGPRCPDETRAGKITCDYAHFDTGTLASDQMQRGTCLTWAQRGVCHGLNCPYEHRQTGVTGLFQGSLQLAGLECEIANAAFNAGFDTSDHEALFALIWVVKRVSLRTMPKDRFMRRRRRRPPQPPHPIYPDCYRPSGEGDDTKRKRVDVDDEKPPPFRAVKPLMRRGSEKADPTNIIDSIDDVKPSAPANSSKRRKVGDGKAVAGSMPGNEIVEELQQLKHRFMLARRDMDKSQVDMRQLFDKHGAMFDDGRIMAILQDLAENLNGCFDRAKDGMDNVERAIAWLDGNGESRIGGNSWA